MPQFTSERERRLWIFTLVVVVAIYSTLIFGDALVGILRNRNLIGALFVLGLVLVLASIVTQGLRSRPGGIELGVALGIAAAYLLVVIRMAIPAVERTHLIEYGVLAVFIYEALTERASQTGRLPSPAVLAVFLTTLVGMLDECIQAFLPNRVFDARDMLFNFLAGLMAVVANVLLRWARGVAK